MAIAGGARDFGTLSQVNYFRCPNVLDPSIDKEFTVVQWFEPDQVSSFIVFGSIVGASDYSWLFLNSNQYLINISGALTVIKTPVTDTPWQISALTVGPSGTNNVKCYWGSEDFEISLQRTSTKTPTISGSGDWVIGTWANFSQPWSGDGAQHIIFNRSLSLKELVELQYNPFSIVDSSLKAHFPLWGVDNPEPDISGNGKTTTSTVGSPGISATSPPIFILGGQ